MKILFMEWPAFGGKTVYRVFEKLGHEVFRFDFPHDSDQTRRGEELGERIAKAILSTGVDLVFSFNFFPIIATAVHACRRKYISWVYDDPAVQLYSMTVFFPENYIFHFDSYEVARLKNDGVEHIWYLPLSADAEEYDKIIPTKIQMKEYSADVAMVGSMYLEKFRYFNKYTHFDPFLSGYLDAVVDAQESLYGVNILEEVLTPDVIKMVQRTVPLTDDKGDSYDTPAWNFANYYLAMRVTAAEREHILQALSEHYDVVLYTSGKTPGMPRVKNKGNVEYYKEAPIAMKCAKINLNVTLRSIRAGVPQRVMDIMGCGGFVLSNYQSDLCELFVPAKDFVYYEDIEDAVDKVGYFLKHEDERLEIAANGHAKVMAEHNYVEKCKKMIEIVNNGV